MHWTAELIRCTPAALSFGQDLASGPCVLATEGEAGLDFFTQLQERLRETYELTQGALTEARIHHKPAYNSPCMGEDFALEAQV